MRTTGLRRAPVPAPRNSWIELSSAESTPRASLVLEHSEEALFDKEYSGVTLRVISKSIPPREGLAHELGKVCGRSTSDLSSSSTSFLTPPPKPPRIYSYHYTPEREEPESSQNSEIPVLPITPTALFLLKKTKVSDTDINSRSPITGSKPLSRDVISNPDISDQLGAQSTFARSSVRTSSNISSSASPIAALFTDTKMAWRSFRRRPQDIPPPPSMRPPVTPALSPAQPLNNVYPSLPSESYTPNGRSTRSNTTIPSGVPPSTSSPGPGSHRPAVVERRPGSSGSDTRSSTGVASPQDDRVNIKVVDQNSLSSPREFEGTCIEALKLSKNARDFMEKKQYNQAAAHYQLALGYIDKVLKTKVLDVTAHEPTRQRFFQMQEAIFATRKECLNGFSDAQAAVAIPQHLSTSTPPPGAPPSYQDVLQEDRRRTRGEPPALPVRPANLRRPPCHSQSAQSQSASRHAVQVQPQSQSRVQPQSQSIDQSQSQMPPRCTPRQRPSQVANQPTAMAESQTPPKLPQRQPTFQNFSHSHPLADPKSPVPQLPPRIQPHSEDAPEVQSRVRPQKPPRHQQPSSERSTQDHEALKAPTEIKPESHSQNKIPTQPKSKTEPKPLTSNAQGHHQHEGSSSQPKSLVPPKPLPRYCLPPETKPLSRDQPQPLLQSQPQVEKNCQTKEDTELYDKPQTSQKLIGTHSSKPLSSAKSEDSYMSVSSQSQDQSRRPAYLRNNNQPIGDLLRQSSREKLEPVSTRPKVSHSFSREGSDEIDTSLPAEKIIESGNQQNKAGIFRFNPLNRQRVAMPSSRSKFYQDEPISLPSRSRLSPLSETSSDYYENTFDMLNSNVTKSKLDAEVVSTETHNTSLPDASLSQLPANTPIPPPRGLKKIKETPEKNKQLTIEPLESLYSMPSKPSKTFFAKDVGTEKKCTVIDDPFATIDPFPLLPSSTNSDNPFPEVSTSSIHTSLDFRNANDADKSQSTTKFLGTSHHLPAPLKPMRNPEVVLQPVVLDAADGKLSKDKNPSIEVENASCLRTEKLGDSILDALDFATTPKHRRVSSQRSKEVMSMRRHSQESLLDFSYNTLDKYLKTSSIQEKKNNNICGSRASIIEEFDPLISLTPETSEREKMDANVTVSPNVEEMGSSDTITPDEENEPGEDYYAVPRKLKWESADALCEEKPENPPQEEKKDRNIVNFPPDLYANTSGEPAADENDKYNYPASPYHIYAELGTRSSIASSGSSPSWSPQVNRFSSTPPLSTPSTSGTSDRDPWKSWPSNQEEEFEEEEAVGRSAFYRATSTDQSGDEETSSASPLPPLGAHGASASGSYRELLRIREGVKIYFIHEDGVITSPWNKPFLSVAKDPSKSWHAQSLLLRVGKSLWSCELMSKQTLAFKTESGTYLFSETNNKPDCVAVAVSVPSSVRKVQHELLSKILHEHTNLELERPSGITKSFSKGAASAASRVNKLVGDDATETNTAFIRRNSIRALKGMSKRLSTLAIKTGSTLAELPPEYENLQNAAITLRFSKTAKTVQYI